METKKHKLYFSRQYNNEMELSATASQFETTTHAQSAPKTLLQGRQYLVPSARLKPRKPDVLQAAKSLFYKRTRTLYSWLHPHALKDQIKWAVNNSWDELSQQERDFYVSQVLGRFGLEQGNLMVNPRLSNIKTLPAIAELPQQNSRRCELQNAISSLKSEEPLAVQEASGKRKRGRPFGSRKNSKPLGTEFLHDPELSDELQKFALNIVF